MYTCASYSYFKKIGIFKVYKPYWNEELQAAGDSMQNNEKDLKKWKGNRSQKTQLHEEYKCSLQKIAKLLKYKEIEYQRGSCIDLESTKINNPREFWSNLSYLGPTKRNFLTWEYRDTQYMNKTLFYKVGKNHFELLYNPVYILCYKYIRELAKFKAEAYDIRKNVIYKPNVITAILLLLLLLVILYNENTVILG